MNPENQNALTVIPSNVEQGVMRRSTPAEAKDDAIAKLTMKVYDKASTLKITPEEIALMGKPFPDEAFQYGAGGNADVIYIEHAYLRDRLNEVFGVGQWAIIPRSRWGEDFVIPAYRDKPERHATRVYVEAMLVIRGCFVAEAIGDMVYYKNNDNQNYGDAVEGAKTFALRRCAKELGIGLQAWKKGFIREWKKRNNAGNSPTDSKGKKTDNAPTEQKITGTLTSDVRFDSWKEKPGITNGKKWLAFICTFTTDSGSTLQCSTFKKEFTESFEVMCGQEVTIVYKSWGNAGKYELISISPRGL